jgi:hypothetical protein
MRPKTASRICDLESSGKTEEIHEGQFLGRKFVVVA